MSANPAPANRPIFVPEVIQASAMDCGPAVLKTLLDGFGIRTNYGRLREACQTDVDGTSLDTLEAIANQLGLEAEQVLVSADHVLLPETQSFPAIVVVQLPNGLPHFVVVWNQIGPLVQVMDPARGRRWLTPRQFLDELFLYTHPMPAAQWRAWAGSYGFCGPLRHRLSDLQASDETITRLMEVALADDGWHAIAALDAATRMVSTLVQAQGLEPGAEAVALLARLFEQARTDLPAAAQLIPAPFWLVRPVPAPLTPAQTEPDTLVMQGAVLVRVLSAAASDEPPAAAPQPPEDAPDTPEPDDEAPEEPETAPQGPLSAEQLATLKSSTDRPELEILRLLRADGLLTPGLLLAALGLATAGVFIQALLLWGILDAGQSPGSISLRLGATIALFILLMALEIPMLGLILGMGHRFEGRLRMAILEQIPRLSDRYFRSRLTSEIAQRVYEMRHLRSLPGLAIRFLRLGFQIVLTTAGIIWLDPASGWPAILLTVWVVGLSFLIQPIFAERDLQVQTHAGALSRFYLDTLLGLVPIRTHSAENAIRREHESLAVAWVRANTKFHDISGLFQTGVVLVSYMLAIWLVVGFIQRGNALSGAILLLFWALSLVQLGQGLAETAQQYPLQRNRLLRLLDPLHTPEATEPPAGQPQPAAATDDTPETGLALRFDSVAVEASERTILSGVDLTISPGEHVAIVGPSGAGKTTFAGLLLGWHRPTTGRVLADDAPLEPARLQTLRRQTVWVDPGVQLWNRSLLDNLLYGTRLAHTDQVSRAIEQTDLLDVLETLPDGLQSSLGENGRLVSGGEGQRVRLGRGLLQRKARLVILDEPFRGLDAGQRRKLLAQVRSHWQAATLIFISHDVAETRQFDRVLVIEKGRIAEDGAPAALAARPTSRYSTLLKAEEAVQALWAGPEWRHLWLERGQLREGERQ